MHNAHMQQSGRIAPHPGHTELAAPVNLQLVVKLPALASSYRLPLPGQKLSQEDKMVESESTWGARGVAECEAS